MRKLILFAVLSFPCLGQQVKHFTFGSTSSATISAGTGASNHGCGTNPLTNPIAVSTRVGNEYILGDVSVDASNTVTISFAKPQSFDAVLVCAISPSGTLSSVSYGAAQPTADCTQAGTGIYVQTGTTPYSWVCGSDHQYWQQIGTTTVSYVTGYSSGMSAVNRWHDWAFKQGNGGIAYVDSNTASSADNLLTFGTGHFDWGPAWSDANNLATNSPADDKRVHLTTGSYSHIASHTMTLTGGQPYTLTLKATSNVAMANQLARLYFYQGGSVSASLEQSYGTTPTVQSYTFTPPTSDTYEVGILNDQAGDSTDLEIACFKLEAGNSSTGCNGVADQGWNAYLGSAALPNAYGAPSWHTGEGLTFPGGNSLYFGYATGTPQTFSAISIYAAVKFSGTPQTASYVPILASEFSDRALTLACADNDTGGGPGFFFGGASVGTIGVNCYDSKAHIFTATYDGSSMVMYMDGLQVATKAQANLSIAALKELFFGNINLYASWAGDIYDVRIYTTADSAATVASNVSLYRTELASNGIAVPAMKVALTCDGDSITRGQGATTNANSNCFLMRMQGAPYTFVQGNNTAVSGSRLHDVGDGNSLDNRTATDDLLKVPGGKNIYYAAVGTNDLSDSVGDVRSSTTAMDAYVTSYLGVITTRIANGYDWGIAATIIPRCYGASSSDAKYEANREYFNSHVKSAVAAATAGSPLSKVLVADYASASAFAYDGTGTNPACSTSFYSGDGIHPNDTGHSSMAAVSQPIVATILSTLNP